MPEQEQGEAGASEEMTPDKEGADDATPPLNREQRRAQTKGKKGAAGGAFNPAANPQHMRGPGNYGAGSGGRFQRKTGGK